jgi:signal transduction histidine kinase
MEARRNKVICEFIKQVDNVLKGKDSVDLAQFREGELSLLENRVNKIVALLREKTDMLEKEKVLLVDSIADISHQIRTPLTSLNIVLSSMRKTSELSDKQAEYCRDMSTILKRIDELVLALLKIARLDADAVTFTKEYVEYNTLVDKIMETLEIPMELKEQELIRDIKGGFEGDISWTLEAVSNIMKNCIEHMDVGGKLYITTKENPIYSEMIIRDTGKGIDQEDLPHLFERFYKGKNSGSSSIGIGLNLCKMIITRQNGTISVKNYPKGGAVFKIKFYKKNV